MLNELLNTIALLIAALGTAGAAQTVWYPSAGDVFILLGIFARMCKKKGLNSQT